MKTLVDLILKEFNERTISQEYKTLAQKLTAFEKSMGSDFEKVSDIYLAMAEIDLREIVQLTIKILSNN